MVQTKILRRAVIVGLVLEIVLVVLGHFVAWVALHAFLVGGMLIAVLAGYLYARDFAKGYVPGALGGAIAGGICAFVAFVLATLLGDAGLQFLLLVTGVSILMGAVGGAFGQIGANMRRSL